MPTPIKNNIGIIVSISMWLLTGAVSVGAAWTILSNLDKNQAALKVDMNNQFTEVKASIEKYKDKCDVKFTEHDQRITRVETKLESR